MHLVGFIISIFEICCTCKWYLYLKRLPQIKHSVFVLQPAAGWYCLGNGRWLFVEKTERLNRMCEKTVGMSNAKVVGRRVTTVRRRVKLLSAHTT